jgi:hypothetical protein
VAKSANQVNLLAITAGCPNARDNPSDQAPPQNRGLIRRNLPLTQGRFPRTCPKSLTEWPQSRRWSERQRRIGYAKGTILSDALRLPCLKTGQTRRSAPTSLSPLSGRGAGVRASPSASWRPGWRCCPPDGQRPSLRTGQSRPDSYSRTARPPFHRRRRGRGWVPGCWSPLGPGC